MPKDRYTEMMGNRRQGNYPMTGKIRRNLMPDTPNAPNGRPVGQTDTVPRQLRPRDENGMLLDPMKGSLNARVNRIMARNPNFNRENVMSRQAGLHGIDTTAEGFDPNRLKQRIPKPAQPEESLPPYVTPDMLGATGGQGGTQFQNQMGGGGMTGGVTTSYPNQAYPNIPQGYQSNIRRKPNANWYRGGERY